MWCTCWLRAEVSTLNTGKSWGNVREYFEWGCQWRPLQGTGIWAKVWMVRRGPGKKIKAGSELLAESRASAKALEWEQAWWAWGMERLELEHRSEKQAAAMSGWALSAKGICVLFWLQWEPTRRSEQRNVITQVYVYRSLLPAECLLLSDSEFSSIHWVASRAVTILGIYICTYT